MTDDVFMRKIRSFVRREGRMTPRQQHGLDDGWSPYGLDIADGMLDPQLAFGNKHKLVLEIGFGMGDSLFEMAKLEPDVNFIGVEVHRPGVGALLANCLDDDINNLRVFSVDVNDVIAKSLPDDSLDVVQIFFFRSLAKEKTS